MQGFLRSSILSSPAILKIAESLDFTGRKEISEWCFFSKIWLRYDKKYDDVLSSLVVFSSYLNKI